jgi:F0F1-type ATP synthase membrane subunit b/b'
MTTGELVWRVWQAADMQAVNEEARAEVEAAARVARLEAEQEREAQEALAQLQRQMSEEAAEARALVATRLEQRQKAVRMLSDQVKRISAKRGSVHMHTLR